MSESAWTSSWRRYVLCALGNNFIESWTHCLVACTRQQLEIKQAKGKTKQKGRNSLYSSLTFTSKWVAGNFCENENWQVNFVGLSLFFPSAGRLIDFPSESINNVSSRRTSISLTENEFVLTHLLWRRLSDELSGTDYNFYTAGRHWRSFRPNYDAWVDGLASLIPDALVSWKCFAAAVRPQERLRNCGSMALVIESEPVCDWCAEYQMMGFILPSNCECHPLAIICRVIPNDLVSSSFLHRNLFKAYRYYRAAH